MGSIPHPDHEEKGAFYFANKHKNAQKKTVTENVSHKIKKISIFT